MFWTESGHEMSHWRSREKYRDQNPGRLMIGSELLDHAGEKFQTPLDLAAIWEKFGGVRPDAERWWNEWESQVTHYDYSGVTDLMDRITDLKTTYRAEWLQWAYSIPVANHRLFDNGNCTVGQSGMVWFLGGRFCNNGDPVFGHYNNVQRCCTVPRGKYLYFPIDNGEDSALEESVNEHPGDINYQQIAYMRQLEDPWTNPAPTEYAIIDGVVVPHLQKYAVQSTVFGFTIPDDNYLTAVYPAPNNDFLAGWYYPAVDNGRYLMLEPLPPGLHTIRMEADWGGWGFDVTYTITVPK